MLAVRVPFCTLGNAPAPELQPVEDADRLKWRLQVVAWGWGCGRSWEEWGSFPDSPHSPRSEDRSNIYIRVENTNMNRALAPPCGSARPGDSPSDPGGSQSCTVRGGAKASAVSLRKIP